MSPNGQLVALPHSDRSPQPQVATIPQMPAHRGGTFHTLLSISPETLRQFAYEASHEGPTVRQQPRPLRISEAGFERLREANTANRLRGGGEQWAYLEGTLRAVLGRLRDSFEGEIACVLLSSEGLMHGIELRRLDYGDVVFDIVLRSNERPVSLYEHISRAVFADLDHTWFLMQFRLITRSGWGAMQEARESGTEQAPHLVLLE